MASYYRTKGFVFKKIDKNESDRIFSIFTEDFGRLEITGKAIRKITSKLRSGIDMFYLSEVEFIQGKNIRTLISAAKIKKFKNLCEDPKRLKITLQISDVLDNFIKGQEKDEKTFKLLEEILDNVCFSGCKINNYQLAFHYFFWNFISFQGYRLEVSNCAVCRCKLDPYNIYFSGKEGGIICGNCATVKRDYSDSRPKINSDVAKILRLVLNKDWQTVSRLKIGQTSQNLLESIFENAVHTFSPVHS
ncbi:MAG: DNA repair protein RecO [bacterium]